MRCRAIRTKVAQASVSEKPAQRTATRRLHALPSLFTSLTLAPYCGATAAVAAQIVARSPHLTDGVNLRARRPRKCGLTDRLEPPYGRPQTLDSALQLGLALARLLHRLFLGLGHELRVGELGVHLAEVAFRL